MDRRSFLSASAVGLPAGAALAQTPRRGRLQQGVARWCFRKWPLEELAANASRLGLRGIDLIGPDEWPVAQKYGLIPSMAPGGGTIAEGLNRTENHGKIEQQLRENIEKAAAAGVPNVIVFSGNRAGLSDREGLDNCIGGLNRVKAIAEAKGVTICLELLNSKVDHKDYQCDRTAWGVEVVRAVDSPRVKLLYDIYHMQIMEGDVIRTIRDNFRYIAHFHTGGVPGRNEIGPTQELNYRAISEAIAALGFTGYFSHEFIPKGDPLSSLRDAVEICTV
jgi:hydroxypyruvate isomerase